MLDRYARLMGTSTAVAAIIVALVIVQVGTQIYALVDLARRQAVRGGRKWPWALVIALGNLPGAMAYLVAGRTVAGVEAAEAPSRASAADGEAMRRALDTLYDRK